jgi:hypothetical protein
MEPFICAGRDVIPRQFHNVSGMSSHEFRIGNGLGRFWHGEINAWPCEIKRDGLWTRLLVPISLFPSQVEALAILADVDGETEREGRYIKVHSAYEAVVQPREVELSAVRHALAHPISSLTRPQVRQALERCFGGLRINLSLHDQKKTFFIFIGRMLIAIDKALFEVFSERWNELDHSGGI